MPSGSTQSFGRFGYASPWSVPGLVLSPDGFRADLGAADTFHFYAPLGKTRYANTTDVSQTILCAEKVGNPLKMRQDLAAPGVNFYVPKGLRLRLTSTAGPMVTWPDGSMEANTGYATPNAAWVMVSFRDGQPPILFGFLGNPGGFKLTGHSGEWWIQTSDDYAGWIRVFAPLGSKPFPTNSVSDLGKLAEACKPALAIASQPTPVVQNLNVTDDGVSLTAEWTYDRPGAILPAPIFTAPLGGYGLQLLSKTTRLDCNTAVGPTLITAENKLTVRFPSRRVPTGRAVAVGNTSGGIATASYLDYASVTELALNNLAASAEKGARDQAVSTVNEFLSECTYALEPTTNQRLPYEASGRGLDLTAAHALLFQTTISTARATSDPNSLLTSLLWRRDALTWQLAAEDVPLRRRAAALTAIAAGIAPEPERRLDGAMLQAGLAAERGLAIWQKRLGLRKDTPPLLEAMESLREDLYGKEDYRRPPGYGKVLLSDLRAFGDIGVKLMSDNKKLILSWQTNDPLPITISLASAYPLTITSLENTEDFQVTQGLGMTLLRIKPKKPGLGRALVELPEWATPLPNWQEAPRYTETSR